MYGYGPLQHATLVPGPEDAIWCLDPEDAIWCLDPEDAIWRLDPEDAIWCLDPEGNPVFEHDRLPHLAFPEKIIVAPGHISLNDWVFYYHPMYKKTLEWLQRTLIGWKTLHPTPEMSELLNEVAEQFQNRISAK